MVVIYNADGTVDLMATREIRDGNLMEEDMEDMLEPMPPNMPMLPQSAYQEFWSDPCWTDPPGPLG